LPEDLQSRIREGLLRRRPGPGERGEGPRSGEPLARPRLPRVSLISRRRRTPTVALISLRPRMNGEVRPPPRREREPQPMDPAGGSYPKMTAYRTDPVSYWVFSMVPVVESERGYLPLILVMRSDSLTGHGVFFDPKPWIYAGIGVLLISGLILGADGVQSHQQPAPYSQSNRPDRGRRFSVHVPDASRGDELGDLGRSGSGHGPTSGCSCQRPEAFPRGHRPRTLFPDLRLQAVVGILEEGGGTEETRLRYLRKVGNEVQQMSALVNELLSFSKASLRREVALVPVDLGSLVHDVLDREESW